MDIIAPPGAEATRSFPGPNGETVVVGRTPLITVRDVIKADTSFAEGSWGLGLHFSPDAIARFRTYTSAHVGDQVAFVVQGQARMVVRILDPNTGDGARISPFDKQAGDALAAEINACARPAR